MRFWNFLFGDRRVGEDDGYQKELAEHEQLLAEQERRLERIRHLERERDLHRKRRKATGSL